MPYSVLIKAGSVALAGVLSLTAVQGKTTKMNLVPAPVFDAAIPVPQVDDALVASALEDIFSAQLYDNYIKITYDEGVNVAVKEAYAMNVNNALWSKASALELLGEISRLEALGLDVSHLKPQTEKSISELTSSESPDILAKADVKLSLSYIAALDVRGEHEQIDRMEGRFYRLPDRLYAAATREQASGNVLMVDAAP